MNAACGPYIIACSVNATTTASTIRAGCFVASKGKNANIQIKPSAAPVPYTPRRPNRSDSAPNSGIVTALTTPPADSAMSAKVRARGYKPPIEEHAAIVRALKRRDPDGARAAMREHLSRVIEDLVEVTEIEELERARAVAAEKRRRYSSTK